MDKHLVRTLQEEDDTYLFLGMRLGCYALYAQIENIGITQIQELADESIISLRYKPEFVIAIVDVHCVGIKFILGLSNQL